MEYTIVQRTTYDFDVYEHFNNGYTQYLGKVYSLKLADQICYDRMNDTKKYGKINKMLINNNLERTL